MDEGGATFDDFRARVAATFEAGMKLKSKMLDRNLTKAWTKCPKCGNRIDAVLAGPKKHLHMACRTADCLSMME